MVERAELILQLGSCKEKLEKNLESQILLPILALKNTVGGGWE